jgi:hypothetical protein
MTYNSNSLNSTLTSLMDETNYSFDDKLINYELRLTTVHLLRALKSIMSYNELSKLFNINISLLCRYIKGQVIPSLEVARNIINIAMQEKLFIKLLHKNYEESSSNSINPDIFYFISAYVAYLINFSSIDKIVCFFPKDAMFGYSLSLNIGKKLLFAYNERSLFPEKYYEHVYYIRSQIGYEDLKRSVAIPKNSIKNSDRLVIAGFYLENIEDYINLLILLKKVKLKVEVKYCIFISTISKKLYEIFTEKVKNIAEECTTILVSDL